MLRRFIAGIAVATGLALGTTGCMGLSPDETRNAGQTIKLTAAQVLGKAAQRTGQVDTYSMDMTMDVQTPEGAVKMDMDVKARVRPEVAMLMNVGSMQAAGQTLPGYEARIVGGAMYMKMPGLQRMTGGKPWGRVSLEQVGKAAGGVNFGQMLDQAKQQSPADQVRMLTGSKNVREVGTETINGVPTRRFAGTVSVQEALAQLDPETREVMRRNYEQAGGNAAIEFEVWVGKDDLPYKMTSKVGVTGGSATVTALYKGYNQPVDVQAPPASQTGRLNLPSLGG